MAGVKTAVQAATVDERRRKVRESRLRFARLWFLNFVVSFLRST